MTHWHTLLDFLSNMSLLGAWVYAAGLNTRVRRLENIIILLHTSPPPDVKAKP